MSTSPPSPGPPQEPDTRLAARLREVAGVMLRLGCTAFGGPAAHVAMLDEEVVRRRRWMTEQEFLDHLGAAGLIPGPTSTELVMHAGMARAGLPGLWLAGACFITPAALITLTFAWAYVRFGALPAAHAVLGGVKPAVVAVILAAVWKLGRQAGRTRALALLGVAALAAYLGGAAELVVLLGCGAVGALLARPWQKGEHLVVLALPLAAPGVAVSTAAPLAATPAAVFLYFLKIGSVLFGSGYVLLAFLRQGLVHDYGWLTEQQLLDAVAAGQFTPGPLFTTATFVGYLVGGWPGAAAATAGIFLPSFLLVWATHGIVRRLRASPWSAGFLDGLSAGSVGLMAGVLLQLAAASLTTPLAWTVAAVATLLAFRTRLNSAWIVLIGVSVGLVQWAFGGFR